MNYSIYLYGNFGSGYTQYPSEESTETLFKEFYANAKSKTQIAIHRDGDLMFYSYIYKLSEYQFIGISLVINHAMLTNVMELFEIFEDAIAEAASENKLFMFDSSGNIIPIIFDYAPYKQQMSYFCDLLSESIREALDNGLMRMVDLPGIDYSVSVDSSKSFSYEDLEEVIDPDEEILSASHTYGFTYIYSSRPSHSEKMDVYRDVIKESGTKKSEPPKPEKAKISSAEILKRIMILIIFWAIAAGLIYLSIIFNESSNWFIKNPLCGICSMGAIGAFVQGIVAAISAE